MKKIIHSPKRRGEWVELQFMARATGKGFTVSKPWGDSARYDFAVEYGGRFHRVQVKSTSHFDGKHYKCYAVSSGLNGRTHPYTADQIDFFAFYLIPEELWYLIPVGAVRDAERSGVYLNPHYPKNRWFKYLEAWDPATEMIRLLNLS